MFVGSYDLKLDEKGRLILPAKLREEFAGGLYLVKGQEGCVYVYTVQYFNDLIANMDASALTSAEERSFIRVFMAGSRHEQLDRQGRVTLPQVHRQYATLEREVTLLGMRTHLEIWDSAKWTQYEQQAEDKFTNAMGG